MMHIGGSRTPKSKGCVCDGNVATEVSPTLRSLAGCLRLVFGAADRNMLVLRVLWLLCAGGGAVEFELDIQDELGGNWCCDSCAYGEGGITALEESDTGLKLISWARQTGVPLVMPLVGLEYMCDGAGLLTFSLEGVLIVVTPGIADTGCGYE